LIDTLGKEDHYFSLHERGQVEAIDSHFMEDPNFYTNDYEINRALNATSLPYDSRSIFESLKELYLNVDEPLECDFEDNNISKYNTSPSPSPSFLVHHFESSISDSLTPFHMISNKHEPFSPPDYIMK